jgi:membrane-bound serine protease (ClpP class)
MKGLLSILLLALSSFTFAQPQALLLNVDGAISPAVADYIERGIKQGSNQQANMIILRMDTPGGLDKSMRQINKAILAAPIPVITYIAPSGARAASAGTFILYASHVAAMSPGTNLGAASPVSIGGGGLPIPSGEQAKDQEKASQKSQDAMTQKVTKDAVAYIRSLAQLRGRDVAFAEKAILNAETLTAEEALRNNVIDIVASDINDLLTQLNGRQVNVRGQQQALNTENIQITRVDPDWRAKLLAVITDPSVAYILLLIGIYGLFFEFANPGFIVPGVAGAIALILALYAFQMLPISYAGLGLVILGIIFMVAEAFVPSFGALGIGGVIAFIAGSVLLMDTDLPGYQIARPLIVGFALLNALFFFIIITLLIRSFKRRVVSGAEDLIGREGVAIQDITDSGQGKIHGEIWTIKSDTPLRQGDKIKVVKSEGLTLIVTPKA